MLQRKIGASFPIGFYPLGDLADFTYYTTRRRKVVRFLRAPPTSPPSWLQRRQRAAWTAAAAAWQTAPNTFRLWWRAVANLNHLKISGYNLYMHLSTANDPTGLAALRTPGPQP